MNATKAFVLVKKADAQSAFELQSISLPAVGSRQVKIKVEAFGLNYADVMARRGLYREAPSMPCVIGYEVVGEISEVGSELSNDLLGKRVVAFTRFGGYAQEAITESYAFAEIENVDAGLALALATQFVTAYYMVERAGNVFAGEKVLIHAAAGGVGTALIQLCKQKGATVFAKIGGNSKRKLVEDLGADHVIVYTESEYEEQLSNILKKERLDVSFNPVAGATFKKDWKLLGSGGRLVLFGGSELANGKWGFLSTLNFVRKMGFVVPIGLMMRSKTISGVNMLKLGDNKPAVLTHCLNAVVKLLKEDKIHPVVGGRYTADSFSKAHAALESGKTVGKLMVVW